MFSFICQKRIKQRQEIQYTTKIIWCFLNVYLITIYFQSKYRIMFLSFKTLPFLFGVYDLEKVCRQFIELRRHKTNVDVLVVKNNILLIFVYCFFF